MDQLSTLTTEIGPTEEHIRVLEAYRREHDIPFDLPWSTAAFNRAVQWWNDGCMSATPIETVEIKLPDLSRVALEPGDALLVRCSRRLSQQQVHLVKAHLGHAFPGHKIVAVTDQIEVSVVRPVPRDDESTSTEGEASV